MNISVNKKNVSIQGVEHKFGKRKQSIGKSYLLSFIFVSRLISMKTLPSAMYKPGRMRFLDSHEQRNVVFSQVECFRNIVRWINSHPITTLSRVTPRNLLALPGRIGKFGKLGSFPEKNSSIGYRRKPQRHLFVSPENPINCRFPFR